MWRNASTVGKIALVATAGSAVSLVIMMVAGWMGIQGAREGEEGPVIFNVLWVLFLLGGVTALVSGIVAVVQGSREGTDATRNAGLIAAGYAVVAVLLVIFAL
jgi:hypothetical protein